MGAFRIFVLAVAGLLIAGCSTMGDTNTKRSVIEQMLICAAVESGIGQTDFAKYEGCKIFIDYSYLAPQVDKELYQGNLEMHLARYGITIVRDAAKADYILQAFCGVLATDKARFLFGTPQLPIPLPNTDLSFAVPEIPIFEMDRRIGFGRFSFNLMLPDRTPVEVYNNITARSEYTSWTVLLIPFSSHNLPLQENTPKETTFTAPLR